MKLYEKLQPNNKINIDRLELRPINQASTLGSKLLKRYGQNGRTMNSKYSTILILALSFFSTPSIGAETYSTDHEKVKLLFQSNEEKTAKDAVWTARDIFKVGVINDGTNRSRYAQYVCSVLDDYGFRGKKIWVQIIDIVKLTSTGKWIKLGEAHCK